LPLGADLLRIDKQRKPLIQALQYFTLVSAAEGAEHPPHADIDSQQHYRRDDSNPQYTAEPMKN
jgi:hypothetical protein